jgi:geranylgeranyl diphosphate/geranylgeranyl-bacteriochlorophyllide a reductase
VVIDGSHPREKPCGGGITGRALEIVAPSASPEIFGGVHINSASFEHRSHRAVVGLGTDGPALVVASRRAFDGALLAAATDAGARHLAERATDVERTTAGWRVETRAGTVEAGWVIGADGPSSLIRRRVFRPFERRELSIASGFFVHGATSRRIDLAFEEGPPGYLWSFPRADHLAVGVCAQADVATSAALQGIASRWFERQALPGTRLERYNWPIPSLSEAALRREEPSGDRWMLIGDAAGLVDPITREGIFFALQSAAFAAESLAGQHAAAEYTERVRSEIHDELARAARLRARFFRPPFIALLVRALQSSAPIRDVMADLVAGRQLYRGLRRRLLGTLEWRLMFDLYRNRTA